MGDGLRWEFERDGIGLQLTVGGGGDQAPTLTVSMGACGELDQFGEPMRPFDITLSMAEAMTIAEGVREALCALSGLDLGIAAVMHCVLFEMIGKAAETAKQHKWAIELHAGQIAAIERRLGIGLLSGPRTEDKPSLDYVRDLIASQLAEMEAKKTSSS